MPIGGQPAHPTALGFSAKSYASILGANDRVNLALIGIRNQGTVHISNWCNLKSSHNVSLRVLCDTDEALFEKASKLVADQKPINCSPGFIASHISFQKPYKVKEPFKW